MFLTLFTSTDDSLWQHSFFVNFISLISKKIVDEIASANFHNPTVDENTDISVSKCLILYFKYRGNSEKVFIEYKLDLGESHSYSLVKLHLLSLQLKEFYKKYKLELYKMLMRASDGAAVMLGRRNGVAVKLKSIPI